MDSENKDGENKVVSFVSQEERLKREQEKIEFQNQAFIEMAKRELTEHLEGATGIISIIFKRDEDTSRPICIWAGNLETAPTIGALELAKCTFINKVLYETEMEALPFFNEDEDFIDD
jgi:hypothetical protein